MKNRKGKPGYIQARKMRYLLWALIGFAIVLILVFIGVMQTGSRLNVFTIVGIIGCLPSAMMLVEFITLARFHSIDQKKADEIMKKSGRLVTAFDLALTVDEKVMPVEAFAFQGHVIVGLKDEPKTDEAKVAGYVKQLMEENHYEKMTVKIFSDDRAFLSRVDDMNTKAQENAPEENDQSREEGMRTLLLSVSM